MKSLGLNRGYTGTLKPRHANRDTSQAGVSGNLCLAFFCDCGMGRNRREERAFSSQTDHIMMSDAVKAVILGIIEGITEFLPVSSTGHMLVAQRFFGLGEGAFWQSFVILIQLGAILAIVMLYFAQLWRVALGMFTNPDDRRFVIGVLLAFLPAVSLG